MRGVPGNRHSYRDHPKNGFWIKYYFSTWTEINGFSVVVCWAIAVGQLCDFPMGPDSIKSSRSAHLAIVSVCVVLLLLAFANREQEALVEALHELLDTQSLFGLRGTTRDQVKAMDEIINYRDRLLKNAWSMANGVDFRAIEIVVAIQAEEDITYDSPRSRGSMPFFVNPSPFDVLEKIESEIETGTLDEVIRALQFRDQFWLFVPRIESLSEVLDNTRHLRVGRKFNTFGFDVQANDQISSRDQNGQALLDEGSGYGYLSLTFTDEEGVVEDSAIFYDLKVNGDVWPIPVPSSLRAAILTIQEQTKSNDHDNHLIGPYDQTGRALPAVHDLQPSLGDLRVETAIAKLEQDIESGRETFKLLGMSLTRDQANLLGPGLVATLLLYLLAHVKALRFSNTLPDTQDIALVWVALQRSWSARVLTTGSILILPTYASASIVWGSWRLSGVLALIAVVVLSIVAWYQVILCSRVTDSSKDKKVYPVGEA